MKMRTRFGMLLTLAEREALRRLADAEGEISQAATVRRLIYQAAQKRNLWPTPTEKQALEQAE